MAVEALCPICGAVFNLRDDMQGKKVRCTKCEHVFTVGGEAKAKEREEKQSIQSSSAPKKSAKDEDDDDRVSSRKAKASGRRGRDDDDDDDDRPRKGGSRRGRDDDDDDDDDDDRPRRASGKRGRDDDDDDDDDNGKGKKPKRVYHDDDDDDVQGKSKKLTEQVKRKSAGKSSSGGASTALIIGGVALVVLLLVCGGVIWGIYAVMHAASDAVADAQDDLNKQMQQGGGPGGPGPWPPAPGPGGQPVQKQIANVNDALKDLKGGNEGERRAALGWLAKANLDKGRQVEVSRAVNPLLKDPDNGVREAAVNALKVWGTKENVDGLIQILNEGNPDRWHHENGFAHATMEAVGKLQDEKAAEPVWRYRAGPSGGEADKSLRTMGAAAGEKAALAHLNDPNGNLRGAARSLLVYYGTKDGPKLTQCVSDLNTDNKDRRGAAAEYLATCPVVEVQRPAVSKALNVTLTDADGGVVNNGINALNRWATTDNVPALAKAVEDDRFPKRHEAMALLGKLKDARGAQAVASRLPNFFDRGKAAEALIAMGPVAKDEVLKYVNHQDQGTRNEAKRVLSSYGNVGNLALTEALGDLKSTDKGRQGAAARSLQTMKVDDDKKAEVAKALEAVVEDLTDRGVQEQAIKALGTWGGKDNVPALVKVVEGADQHPNCINAAMDVLAKLKDDRAIKSLAARLVDNRYRAPASKALIALGPDLGEKIEAEVAAGLFLQDIGLKKECAKVLGAVGTKKVSIPQLDKAGKAALALKPPQKDVAQACQDAILEINKR